MNEIYLYVKNGEMYSVPNEVIKTQLKKSSLYEVLARVIDSEYPPRITFTDLLNDYTIISDDDGLVTAEYLYGINDVDDTVYNIPGTFIIAKLDSNKNVLPLNNEDCVYFQTKILIQGYRMLERM